MTPGVVRVKLRPEKHVDVRRRFLNAENKKQRSPDEFEVVWPFNIFPGRAFRAPNGAYCPATVHL